MSYPNTWRSVGKGNRGNSRRKRAEFEAFEGALDELEDVKFSIIQILYDHPRY